MSEGHADVATDVARVRALHDSVHNDFSDARVGDTTGDRSNEEGAVEGTVGFWEERAGKGGEGGIWEGRKAGDSVDRDTGDTGDTDGMGGTGDTTSSMGGTDMDLDSSAYARHAEIFSFEYAALLCKVIEERAIQ